MEVITLESSSFFPRSIFGEKSWGDMGFTEDDIGGLSEFDLWDGAGWDIKSTFEFWCIVSLNTRDARPVLWMVWEVGTEIGKDLAGQERWLEQGHEQGWEGEDEQEQEQSLQREDGVCVGNEEGEVGLELGRWRGRGSVDGRGVEDGDTILQSSPTSLSSLNKKCHYEKQWYFKRLQSKNEFIANEIWI